MTERMIYGLIVNIIPTRLKVRFEGMCPIHNKPMYVVTTLDGKAPDAKCIECLTGLFEDLIDEAEEHTANIVVNGG